jgi:hypothetical protein
MCGKYMFADMSVQKQCKVRQGYGGKRPSEEEQIATRA